MSLRIMHTVFGGAAGRVEASGLVTKGKITSFLTLPVGWNYGYGKPVTRILAKEVLSFHVLLESFGIEETDAFPGEDGEILLRAYTNEYCASFMFNPDGTVDISFEDRDIEIYSKENASRAEMLSLALKVAAKCGIFASQTLSISTGGKVDLWNSPLRNTRQMTQLQSSRKIVLSENQEEFAITSKNITPPTSQEALRFSGFLTTPNYQVVPL